MSDDREEGGVSGGGVVLGVGGATGAAYVGDKMLSRNGVAEAWKGGSEAPKSIADKVAALFKKKDAASVTMKEQADGINAFNKISDPNAAVEAEKAGKKVSEKTLEKTKKAAEDAEKAAKEAAAKAKGKVDAAAKEAAKKAAEKSKTASANYEKMKTASEAKVEVAPKAVTESKIVADKAKKATKIEFTEHTTGKPVTQKINIEAAPKDIKVGTAFKSEEAIGKSFTETKPLVQKAEKALTTEVRAATGLNKMGSGLKFGSNMGRGKVAAAVLATAAVGYGIGSVMFPSHARRIEGERAVQHDMGRA